MIASPPVQPSSSMTSGTGSVSTMWLDATVSRERSGANAASAPPAASTTCARADAARRRSSIDAGAPRDDARTRVFSKIARAALEQPPAQPEREPRRLHRRAAGISTPPRKRGEAQRARISSAVERDDPVGDAELGRAAATAARPTPSCAGVSRRRCARRGGTTRRRPRRGTTRRSPSTLSSAARRDRQRAVVAEPRAQRRQAQPDVLDEPAVAPARPVPAQAGLEQHDARAGARARATRSTAPCSRRRR